MSLRTHVIELSPAGAAGAAADSKIISLDPCELVAVKLDYTGQPGATTDVTITCNGKAVYTRSNTATDSFEYVRNAGVDQAGAALAAGDNKWVEPVLAGPVTIAVAQGDPATNGVVATLITRV